MSMYEIYIYNASARMICKGQRSAVCYAEGKTEGQCGRCDRDFSTALDELGYLLREVRARGLLQLRGRL